MGFIGSVLAPITGILAFILGAIKAAFFYTVRIDGRYKEILFEKLKKEGKYFSFTDNLSDQPMPKIGRLICRLNKAIFIVDIEERMLRAGFTGTDTIISAITLRFYKKRFLETLKKDIIIDDRIPINILQEWYSSKVGELVIPETIPEPYLHEYQYKELIEDIEKVIDVKDKKHLKVGANLYGPPGNGKSFFIRLIAFKYKLPINIVSFTSDMDNHSIIKMFGNIKGPAIVLFEDFDNYFNKRNCLMRDCKFTFDTLLNVLDGMFSSPENIIFFMTSNNLDMIDYALKSRPSRFKYNILIDYPDREIRKKVFKTDDKYILNTTQGCTLDMLLFIKDKINEGNNFDYAYNEVRQNYKTESDMEYIKVIINGQDDNVEKKNEKTENNKNDCVTVSSDVPIEPKEDSSDEIPVLINGKKNGWIGNMIIIESGFVEISAEVPGVIPLEIDIKDTTKSSPMEIKLDVKKI